MPLIKPPALLPGDKIAIISASSGYSNLYPHVYHLGIQRLRDIFGLVVVELKHTHAPADFLSSHPEKRAEDLMAAFENTSIKAIFTSIGGDEAIRILPYINYEIIQKNPKIVMGFSDSTVLLFICLKAGLSCFYGPSVMCGFAEQIEFPDYTIDSIGRHLFSILPVGKLEPSSGRWTEEFLHWGDKASLFKHRQRQSHAEAGWKFLQGEGSVSGHLMGGCLELLNDLKDTDVWPSEAVWEDSILFIETSEQGWTPTQVQDVLRELGRRGLFLKINALLFGRPGGQISYEDFEKYDSVILAILKEFGCEDLIVISHMDFGHTVPVFIIPYGSTLTINVATKTVSIEEPSCIARKEITITLKPILRKALFSFETEIEAETAGLMGETVDDISDNLIATAAGGGGSAAAAGGSGGGAVVAESTISKAQAVMFSQGPIFFGRLNRILNERLALMNIQFNVWEGYSDVVAVDILNRLFSN